MEHRDDFNTVMASPSTQQKKPILSWGLKIKRKLKMVVPFLAKFRPPVGHCCHQCTPLSLDKKSGHSPTSLGFQNLLDVNENNTRRYRGWLVRKVCCMLFVSGCKVYPSPVTNRLERIFKSNRVRDALATLPEVEEERQSCISPYLPLINTCISPHLLRFVGWVTMKILGSVFCSVQVNLNHLAALRKETQKGSLLVYVYVHQSIMDCMLISLVLFCNNLRVPYTFCPLQINCSWLRLILQKLGVILLPPGTLTEQDAQMDSLYSPVMTALVGELLGEGQALSVGVWRQSGGGGQWLALIRRLITEGAVSDVSLVPVGIAYDCVPKSNVQTGLISALRSLYSALHGGWKGSVRIHFAQPFSLKEICNTGRCRVDGWRPLQDLLLPVIFTNSTDSIFGQRLTSWLLPHHCAPELDQSERNHGIALILHLIYSTTSCMAVMSTSVMSGLLLHRHRKGVHLSALCRDVVWLIEEVVLRDMDVGFGGSLVEVVYHSLRLLTPHLIIAGIPSRKDPFIIPRPSLSATLSLSQHTQILTHTFRLEAVGACSVTAMLCGAAGSGIGSGVRSAEAGGDEDKADMEFDVALCQTELTERALQLCHLLPPGFMPPCQSANSFAVEAVDSLVRCGVLIMEEVLRDAPACDAYKKLGTLNWSTSDDPYHDESDSEDGEPRFYKLSQPSQCPEMLLFLCSLLSAHLRALRFAIQGLDLLRTPLPEADCVSQIHLHLCNMANKDRRHYESCSEEAARTAVRTLMDLGVIVEEQQSNSMFLAVSPRFQLADNQQKLQCFISQYIYD